MSCIHGYCSPLNLLTLQKQRHNAERTTNICCHFSGYSTIKHAKIISQVRVVPLNVDDFPTLTLAVAKPPNLQVLFQTSALLIFVYLIANFVVPQFLSKSLEFDKVDENDQPKLDTYSVDKEKASSTTTKSGSNSTKRK